MAIQQTRSDSYFIEGSLTDIFYASDTDAQNTAAPIILFNEHPNLHINLTNTGAALTDFALLGQVYSGGDWHTLISGATWGTVAGTLKKYIGALNTLASGSAAYAYVDIGHLYAIKFQGKISSGVRNKGTLTLAANAVADETVTIGSTVYTWKGTVSTTANEVLVGASATASCNNLVAAINGAAGGGSTYGSATVAHTQVTAVRSSDTVVVTANDGITDAVGTLIATTETMTQGSWGATTLADAVMTAISVGVVAHK